jgi:hypothetical protein
VRPTKAPAAVALTLVATLPACARPGDTPTGTPSADVVTMHMSAAPAPPVMLSRIAVPPSWMPAGCANPIAARPAPPRGARTIPPTPKPATIPGAPNRAPAAIPSAAAALPGAANPGATGPEVAELGAATPDVADSEAAERARRALEAANPPIPRRAPVPPEAAAVAEACARKLQPELTLLAASPGGLADDKILRTMLTNAGLTTITIQPGPAFAATAGKACVYGTFPNGKPELSIGPQQPNGTCRP